MTCQCIAEVNTKLHPHNTALTVPIQFGGGPTRLVVGTHQIESGRGKKRAAIMVATFCPFCGLRYEAEPARPATSAELIAMLDDPKVAAAVNEQGGGRSA